MTGFRRTLAAVPPFLAGVAGAVAFETSAGLLLYLDQGLLPALTLVLTVEVGALGLGLWSSSLPIGTGAIEQVRRRWLFTLVVFAVAASLAVGMGFDGGSASTGLSQGLGLAFLGSLPLFALGSLLGAMGRPDDLGRSSVASVGVPSVLGVAAGFLLTGGILLPVAAPYTLYLFCLVALSGGALLQGWALDSRPLVKLNGSAQGAHGEIRVEERVLGRPRREVRVLTEGGVLRGAEDLNGNPGRGWERAVLSAVTAGETPPLSLVFLGGGSGTFVRLFSDLFPEARVDVLERSPELVALARTHFHPGPGMEEVILLPPEPLAALDASEGPGRLILVDCGVLPSRRGAPVLNDAGWGRLARAVEGGGMVVLGGLRSNPSGDPVPLLDLVESAGRWFESVSLYEGESLPDAARILPGEERGVEAFLALAGPGTPSWPSFLADFQRRQVGEA